MLSIHSSIQVNIWIRDHAENLEMSLHASGSSKCSECYLLLVKLSVCIYPGTLLDEEFEYVWCLLLRTVYDEMPTLNISDTENQSTAWNTDLGASINSPFISPNDDSLVHYLSNERVSRQAPPSE